MLDRGIPEEHVRAVCYENALAAYSQTGQMKASDWLNPQSIDQRQMFSGNSVLRGQEPGIKSVSDFVLIE
jgi:hypothetical protein